MNGKPSTAKNGCRGCFFVKKRNKIAAKVEYGKKMRYTIIKICDSDWWDSMEKTIVLRRDYTYIYEEDREDNSAAKEFWGAVWESPKLREAFELRRSTPRMINPSHQNVFTYMVKEADAFARDFGGTIEASIDYDRYKAEIKLLLPFFDMTQKREKFFFMKAMALTDSIDVSPAADNENINVTLNFKYFTELTASKEDLERAAKLQSFMQEMAETLGDYDDEDN